MVALGIAELVVLAVFFFVVYCLITAVTKFGIGRVFLGIGLVVLTLILIAVPFLWLLRVERQPAIYSPVATSVVPTGNVVEAETAVIEEGVDWASQESNFPDIPRAELDSDSASAAASTISLASEPKAASAVGEVVGGESTAWSTAFDTEHIADLYSSPIEAAKSIARRCGEILERSTDDQTSRPITYFETEFIGVHADHDLSLAFKSELRRAAPSIKISADKDELAIPLQLRKSDPSVRGGPTTFLLTLDLDGDQIDLVAKYVDKPWVKNDVRFRLSEQAPKRYLVALGDSTNGGESAIEAAAKHLEKDVAHYVQNNSHGWSFSSREFPAITRTVAASLAKDKFSQVFETKTDGTRAEDRVTREAILIDCTQRNLYRAIYAAKVGREFVLNAEPESGPFRQSTPADVVTVRYSPRLDRLLPMAAVILLCCGAIKGVSRKYDGPE